MYSPEDKPARTGRTISKPALPCQCLRAACGGEDHGTPFSIISLEPHCGQTDWRLRNVVQTPRAITAAALPTSSANPARCLQFSVRARNPTKRSRAKAKDRINESPETLRAYLEEHGANVVMTKKSENGDTILGLILRAA